LLPNADIRATTNASLEGANVRAAATATLVLVGDKVWLNGCAQPVARVGDDVSTQSGAGRIASGSPSVCVG
jgi:hypothetical protein